MDRFKQLETFVAVAEAGGFNAAARGLRASPPTVTRLVAALEQRVGTRLLSRTTRQVALTEPGRRLFEDARRILSELDVAEASAAGAHETPQGVLCVTGPVKFGQMYIAPILRDFLDLHPGVRGRALFLDRIVDLIEEGQDVAVRIGELPESSLTAVRVGAVRQLVVAAPSYLARYGAPQTLEALSDRRLVTLAGLTPRARWSFVRDGAMRDIRLDPGLSVNTVDGALDAALSGWGITRLLSYQVSEALTDGRLVEVLPGRDDRVVPVHVVHAEGTLRAAKVRAFMDFASTRLRRSADDWGSG